MATTCHNRFFFNIEPCRTATCAILVLACVQEIRVDDVLMSNHFEFTLCSIAT